MISDRRTVELLFPVEAMRRVIWHGVDQTDPDFRVCMDSFAEADRDAMGARSKAEWTKVRKRTTTLHAFALPEWQAPFVETGNVGLIVFAGIEAMLDSEFLIYHRGSAIERGINLFLGAIDHYANAASLAAARERAVKLIADLQGLGYYGAPAAR